MLLNFSFIKKEKFKKERNRNVEKFGKKSYLSAMHHVMERIYELLSYDQTSPLMMARDELLTEENLPTNQKLMIFQY